MSDKFFDNDKGPQIRSKLNELWDLWQQATSGSQGEKGWSPVLALEEDQDEVFLKVLDWEGGEGDKPTSLGYVTSSGLSTDKANAVNVKGLQGDSGTDGTDGEDGESAYAIAVRLGFIGTEQQWIDSLVGATGDSAYKVAQDNGFVGTQQEWLDSLDGEKGDKGDKGDTGGAGKDFTVDAQSVLADRANYDSEPTGFSYLATDTGELFFRVDPTGWSDPIPFGKGEDGVDGKSAYQLALDSGFVGSVTDWLDSLKGEDGTDGTNGTNGVDGLSAYQVALDNGFTGTVSEWLDSLKGQDGEDGADSPITEDAPLDALIYGRKNGDWVEVEASGGGHLIDTPVILSVTGTGMEPLITFTPFDSDTKVQDGIQLQVSTDDTFGHIDFESELVETTGNTFQTLFHNLEVETKYYIRVRYVATDLTLSKWSTPFEWTSPVIYTIPIPVATPSNFGDPLEGGFYAGKIWNEVCQSSTSHTVSSGSFTFDVPSNKETPKFYIGQSVEVRSRANPNNAIVGTINDIDKFTVTVGTSQTRGSGTHNDWSIMAAYRVIVSPKAQGDIASVALKNSQSALPVDCQTLSEGFRATESMYLADTVTVYPAAHAARTAVINDYRDWHIPSRDELELLWRNLKPTTDNNYVIAGRPAASTYDYKNRGSYGDTSDKHGVSPNTAPAGSEHTASNPSQTSSTAFRTGGSEAMVYGSVMGYWSSSDYTEGTACRQSWGEGLCGLQDTTTKNNRVRLRLVRRSIS